jgi:hypothetical protein
MSQTNKKTARSNILGRILAINTATAAAAANASSSPDLEVIRKFKEHAQASQHPQHSQAHSQHSQAALADNPMFLLTMEEYEYMSDNEMTLSIVAKMLKIDIKKLKKITRQIHIFIENIKSSPETIKDKMKAQRAQRATQVPIFQLPPELREDILTVYENMLKYDLRDWIPKDRLRWDILVYNYNAIDLLDANPNMIVWENLPSNTNQEGVASLIRKYVFGNPKYKKFADNIDWAQLSSNPFAIDLLETIIKAGGADPTNNRVDWYLLCKNPAAIHILSDPKHLKLIEWSSLSSNPSAIALLADKWREEKRVKAADMKQYEDMRNNGNIVAWNILSRNPNAIDLLRKKIREERKMTPADYDKLEDNEKIAWSNLCENPEAITLLEKSPDKIVWFNLSANKSPRATKLLMERVEYENSLSKDTYNHLTNKINWAYMSNNQNAIKILEANQSKIVRSALSNNPKAIKILETNQGKIDWEVLSGNPEAIRLLKENPQRIVWDRLARNTNAMSILEANQANINWGELSANEGIFILR